MVKFNQQVQEQFDKMCSFGKLFRVAMTGQQVWDLYIASFDKDPKFRDPASSEHNCNLCNNFLRRYGNIVAINENFETISLFDFDAQDEYVPVAKALSAAIKVSPVKEVFFETFNELNSLPYEACKKTQTVFQLGVERNSKRYTKEEAEKFGVVKPNEIRSFDHIHLHLPAKFVDQSGASIEAIMGEYRQANEVFQRAMETISLDTLVLVKDLINQGSLLDGTSHLFKIEQIIPMKKAYDELAAKDRANWCWVTSYKLPYAKFRNELIGVLCSELSEGKELNEACQSWNKRVDPANYMKATAPITAKQIEEAKKFVEENGFTESFNRRFADMDDIKAPEILHMNVGDGKIKAVSIFDTVKAASSTRHKRSEFDGVEEVGIEKFMKDILPSCTSVEAFLTNYHEKSMVSLTTANDTDSKPIFKWSNNFSWTFNGNLAGKSQIKEAVKSAGGNVDGILNFRLAWNEEGTDNCDLDLWASEPSGSKIGYSTSYRKGRGYGGSDRSPNSGQLDVDIVSPGGKLAVENITWTDGNKMKDGVYKVWVNPYSGTARKGFKMEIEIQGDTYLYHYNQSVTKNVHVAEVTLKDGKFSIVHILPATDGQGVSKEIYGLDTNQFHKVNLVCLSPNHWDGNSVGNKHYFFMLDKCKSPVEIRSFHNENLISELLNHRKVLEVLGTKTMVKPTDKQLSGLGFNATVRDELIVRLQGSHKRVVKIKF